MIARYLSAAGGRVTNMAQDRRAIGAVEFAITAPFLILLYLGGFQLMDAISAYRKVTITTRTLADLVARTPPNVAITKADLQTILDASRQVMVPFKVSNATSRITAIDIDMNRKVSIEWSVANRGDINHDGDLTIPNKLKVAGSSVILSEISYDYVPVAGGELIGPLTFKDSIYMNPRNSNTIPCSDCAS